MESSQITLSRNKQSNQQSNQHPIPILHSDVIQKIINLAHIHCDTCQVVMTDRTIFSFKKHDMRYYCSPECFNHI